MKKWTIEEFNNFESIDGKRICLSGDYSLITFYGAWNSFVAHISFGESRTFGENCSFGKGCSFGAESHFGGWCTFGEGCNFEAGCSFGERCSFEEGCSFGERCSFGKECSFWKLCSFGKGSSFGELCSFGKECTFGAVQYTLLLSNLGKINDKLTLELMRRDAKAHPEPKAFDEWANGGRCPYSGKYNNIDRVFEFEESRELWIKGDPEMNDYDLIYEIAACKGWVFPEKIIPESKMEGV